MHIIIYMQKGLGLECASLCACPIHDNAEGTFM